MILRGTRISARAVRVGAPRPTVATPPAGPRDAVAPVVAVAPWSVADVETWLRGQDRAVRAGVAALLADEIAAHYEDARSGGSDVGYSEGQARADSESAAKLAALARIAAELEQAFERRATALEASCCEIAMEALAKLAGSALASRKAVTGAVAAVIKRAKSAQQLVVRVRPAELEPLRAAESALRDAAAGAEITLVADPRVELGGCIVESKTGNLDGRLEVQLRELCETLRAAKSSAGAAA